VGRQRQVLRNQIVAFKYLTKGEGKLPADVLAAIVPPPLGSDQNVEVLTSPPLAANSAAVKQEKGDEVDGTQQQATAASRQDHCHKPATGATAAAAPGPVAVKTEAHATAAPVKQEVKREAPTVSQPCLPPSATQPPQLAAAKQEDVAAAHLTGSEVSTSAAEAAAAGRQHPGGHPSRSSLGLKAASAGLQLDPQQLERLKVCQLVGSANGSPRRGLG
jgi:hypothetical protein